MRRSCLALHLTAALLLSSPFHCATAATPQDSGDSNRLQSHALHQQRHKNVYQPRA